VVKNIHVSKETTLKEPRLIQALLKLLLSNKWLQILFQLISPGKMLMELTILLRSKTNIFQLIVDHAGPKVQLLQCQIELRL